MTPHPIQLSDLSATDQKRIKELSRKSEELEVSVRIANRINERGCEYVWEVCAMTEEEWLLTRGFQTKSLQYLREALAKIGLDINMGPQIEEWRHLLPKKK